MRENDEWTFSCLLLKHKCLLFCKWVFLKSRKIFLTLLPENYKSFPLNVGKQKKRYKRFRVKCILKNTVLLLKVSVRIYSSHYKVNVYSHFTHFDCNEFFIKVYIELITFLTSQTDRLKWGHNYTYRTFMQCTTSLLLPYWSCTFLNITKQIFTMRFSL